MRVASFQETQGDSPNLEDTIMTTRKSTRAFWMVAALGVAMGGIACAGSEAVEPGESTEATESPVISASLGDQIEKAVRDIETGRNLKEARATLDQALVDPTSTSDQRDDARLALSRYHELSGDKEAAVRVVEELLASHRIDMRYAARGLAEKRLRLLLTGSEEDAPRLPADTTVAPVAKALADHFVAGADGSTTVEILIFGRTPDDDDTVGTFNIAGAIREKKQEDCPLCNDSTNTHTSRSQTSSWVSIPAAAAADPAKELTPAKSLTVYYYDLETNRVPSRYDAYLPLPSEQIAAHLEKGEGLIAVKTREGAPPIVVLAAPRWAMLSEVEKAFANMTELPKEPTPVALNPTPRPKEIQAVVRSSYPKMRKCYETHLASVPDARGKIVMSFAIDAEGAVQDLDSSESTLTDGSLRGCFETVFSGMKFPATGGRVTVKYPISLTP